MPVINVIYVWRRRCYVFVFRITDVRRTAWFFTWNTAYDLILQGLPFSMAYGVPYITSSGSSVRPYFAFGVRHTGLFFFSNKFQNFFEKLPPFVFTLIFFGSNKNIFWDENRSVTKSTWNYCKVLLGQSVTLTNMHMCAKDGLDW